MCKIATILASTPNQQDEANANARLIAAAPDLLEASKELVKYLEAIDPYVVPSQQVDDLKDAIAKAEGAE